MGCQNNEMIAEMDIAVGYGDNEDYEKALDKIGEIEEKYGESIETIFMSGEYYIELQYFEKAIKEYEKALQLDIVEPFSSKGEIYSNIGFCYNQIDEFDTAIAYLDQGIELKSEFPDLFTQRAYSHFSLFEDDKALMDYHKAINLQPENDDLYLRRAIIYINMKEFTLALTNLLKAKKMGLNSSLLHSNLSRVYYEKGELEKALSESNIAINEDPSVTRYHNRSVIKIDLKDTTGAIEDINRAVAMEPENPRSYASRAFGYFDLGFVDKALKDYNKVIQLEPSVAQNYQDRGFYYYRIGEYELAVSDFDAAINLDEHQEYAHNNRANSKFKLGDIDGACTDWHKALENGYVYESIWKEEYDIDNPIELIKKYCNN